MKKFKSVMIVLGLSMLLNGCSSLNAQQTISEEQEVKVTEVPQENLIEGKNKEVDSDRDSSREQINKPDIVGEISEIIGNEMTIKEVNMPEIAQTRQVPEQAQQEGNDQEASEEKKQPKAITGSTDGGFPGGGMPGGFQGGMPGGAQGGQGRAGGQGANVRSSTANAGVALKLDYTGEEKTVTIPVGMAITGGRGQGEITFETLQTGNVISIWLDDTESIERISLIGGQ